ncbi:hypothetical protein K491DRAFT_674905 [Lophiostoma macrostomum CBS 122681]|uniref:Uncharacterized protein n=1 Tax=Lophiostoma macrostomum CBS 122681 TaxID=1314788 RepID=A0A6A6TKL8_9PLEO|nr:hypothetical protein K491DRAFT_674905 [Lophiostoma macrostomum CBS 122681]
MTSVGLQEYNATQRNSQDEFKSLGILTDSWPKLVSSQKTESGSTKAQNYAAVVVANELGEIVARTSDSTEDNIRTARAEQQFPDRLSVTLLNDSTIDPPGDSLEYQKVQAIVAQQALQDGREELLGLRYALRTRRKELANLRRNTTAAEGRVLDHIRQFVQTGIQTISGHISREYEYLNALRDQLGSSEVRYEQDEQMYNEMEFRYTQREADFVKNVTGAASHSYNVPRTDNMRAESDILTRFADGPEHVSVSSWTAMRLPSERSLFGVDAFDMRTANMFEAPAIKSQHVIGRDDLSTRSLPELRVDARSNPKPAASVYSEGALFQTPWLDARKRVDTWLWDSLQGSTLQQAMLRQYVSQETLNDAEWWSLVRAHWDSGTQQAAQADEDLDDDDDSYTTINGPSMLRSPLELRSPTEQHGPAVITPPEWGHQPYHDSQTLRRMDETGNIPSRLKYNTLSVSQTSLTHTCHDDDELNPHLKTFTSKESTNQGDNRRGFHRLGNPVTYTGSDLTGSKHDIATKSDPGSGGNYGRVGTLSHSRFQTPLMSPPDSLSSSPPVSRAGIRGDSNQHRYRSSSAHIRPVSHSYTSHSC